MTERLNSRPEYHAKAPIWPGRPGVGSIDAVYVDGEGWNITLTPNEEVLKNPLLTLEWDHLMQETERRTRFLQLQEFPPNSPIRHEIKAYYQTAVNHVNADAMGDNHRYTIRMYDCGGDFKLELKGLLNACNSLAFEERADKEGDLARHKLLDIASVFAVSHQLGILDFSLNRTANYAAANGL